MLLCEAKVIFCSFFTHTGALCMIMTLGAIFGKILSILIVVPNLFCHEFGILELLGAIL